MSFAAMLALVLLATYGLASLLLSTVVALACAKGLDRFCATSNEILVLRLLPAWGAALLTLTVVLPAFLILEPLHEFESVGPLLPASACVALLTMAAAGVRGLLALVATRVFLRAHGTAESWRTETGQNVELIDIAAPVVAVVGGWRPRFVADRRVLGACNRDELSLVIAHEAAHITARDNLKLLLTVVSPDVLAWLPAGKALTRRWRMAAEIEADARATGSDRKRRVTLAAALIKVARLAGEAGHVSPAISMSIARDDIADRVRHLLTPLPEPLPATRMSALVTRALLVPVVGVPLYGLIHQCIEALVALGR